MDRAKDRRGIVGATPPQSGQLTFRGCADKARHDGDDAFFEQRPQPRLGFRTRQFHLRFGATVKRVGHDQFRGFDRFAWQTQLSDRGRHERCGEPFPQA